MVVPSTPESIHSWVTSNGDKTPTVVWLCGATLQRESRITFCFDWKGAGYKNVYRLLRVFA